MTQTEKTVLSELVSDLKQQRDQIRVRLHLASMEAREEFEKLDDKFDQLNHRFDPIRDAVGETTEDVWDSLKQVGTEVGAGFRRILRTLVD